VPCQILVCTFTNVAVDNLLEAFVKAGLKPLRVGSNAFQQDILKEFSLEVQLSEHPLQPPYRETLEALKEMENQVEELISKIEEAAKVANTVNLKRRLQRMCGALIVKQRQLLRLKSKLYGLEQEMLHDVVKSADVVSVFPDLDQILGGLGSHQSDGRLFGYGCLLIPASQVCTTCIKSASSALNVCDFPILFIDEASMSTEPATLIPIMKGVSRFNTFRAAG